MKRIDLLLLFLVTISSSVFAQKVNLQLQLKEGATYAHNISSNVTVSQTIKGKQVDMGMYIDGRMSYRVVKADDSAYDLSVQYDRLFLRLKILDYNLEFNSDSADPKNIFSSVLSSLKDKAFKVKITKLGRVLEVKDLDTLFSSVFEKFPQLTAEQKAQIRGQLMRAYGENAFKGSLEMSSAIFPDHPVAVGDKWNIQIALESGMAATMQTTYTLEAQDDSSYLIAGNATIETADKDAYIQSEGMPMKYNLSGSMASKIRINKDNGWIIKNTVSEVISGDVDVRASEQIPEGMIIPMTMKNEMTVTD